MLRRYGEELADNRSHHPETEACIRRMRGNSSNLTGMHVYGRGVYFALGPGVWFGCNLLRTRGCHAVSRVSRPESFQDFILTLSSFTRTSSEAACMYQATCVRNK
jgi:hypothetical protein